MDIIFQELEESAVGLSVLFFCFDFYVLHRNLDIHSALILYIQQKQNDITHKRKSDDVEDEDDIYDNFEITIQGIFHSHLLYLQNSGESS
jgi:hypothetical protein